MERQHMLCLKYSAHCKNIPWQPTFDPHPQKTTASSLPFPYMLSLRSLGSIEGPAIHPIGPPGPSSEVTALGSSASQSEALPLPDIIEWLRTGM